MSAELRAELEAVLGALRLLLELEGEGVSSVDRSTVGRVAECLTDGLPAFDLAMVGEAEGGADGRANESGPRLIQEVEVRVAVRDCCRAD